MEHEYAAFHLPGSRLLPLPDLPDHLEAIDRKKPVVVYCRSGKRSAAAAALLAGAGFPRVTNMLSKRVIPCLDVRDGKLTKGIKFKGNVDIGDPVEMARIYYEEGADELVFYDITASSEGRGIMAVTPQENSRARKACSLFLTKIINSIKCQGWPCAFATHCPVVIPAASSRGTAGFVTAGTRNRLDPIRISVFGRK